MSCAGRHHLAKRSEATRDFTDTNWDGTIGTKERLAVVECDTGNGFLKVHNLSSSSSSSASSGKNNEEGAEKQDEGESFLVSLPGKFHKLIWFLRGDIIVHDTETCIRKVSEEQLQRLAKENGAGSIWHTAETVFSSRRQDTLMSQERQDHAQKRKELVAAGDEERLQQESEQALKGNPNRASHHIATGFTSSEDDDDDDDDDEDDDGQEEGDEAADHDDYDSEEK